MHRSYADLWKPIVFTALIVLVASVLIVGFWCLEGVLEANLFVPLGTLGILAVWADWVEGGDA